MMIDELQRASKQ